MKKILAIVLALAIQSPASAAPGNEVPFVVSYAGGYLYCNNSIGLTAYLNGQLYDNNGSCLDLTETIQNDPNYWYYSLLQTYPGGIHRWKVTADTKHCYFDTYQASPVADTFVAYEIVFAACAVKLNQPVKDTWYMVDYEETNFEPIYLEPDLLQPVNDAVTILNSKFRKPFKVWATPVNGKLCITISTSPSGSKFYLQKWVDYKWVTVKTIERYWEPKGTYTYKTQSGKYRLIAKSLSGMNYASKEIVIP